MDIATYMRKQDVLNDKKKVIANFLVKRLGDNATIDRWEHVKITEDKNGKTNHYRYKIMERVVRLEVQIETSYEKRWIRLKSYNFNKVYNKALKEL